MPQIINERAPQLQLFAFDVDGILTDGAIIYDSTGAEIKSFFVQDGLGITGLIDAGITVALITGRESSMVTRRAQELNIPHVIQGEDDKITALSKLANKLNIPLQHCGYMGDDLIDVAAIRQAGLGVSVPNGCSEAQQAADYVTNNHGGRGAVREVCDLIMQAIDHYPKHLAKYGAN